MRARVGLVAVIAIAACSPPDRAPRWKAAGNATPRAGGTLHVATKENLTTLDPTITYDEATYYVLRLLYESLLDYAPGGTELVGRLAERWELSADATTYTFWLRPGTRYSDGAPIVAGDVKYSLERALSTADSPFSQWLADIVGADAVIAGTMKDCAGITTPSDHELVIRLAHPNAGFAYVMAMPFTTPQRAAHVVAAGEQLRRTPLSSGPFVVAEWSEGERLVATRNPVYAGNQRVYLDSIVMLENVPRDTQFLMFERGELDTVDRLAAPDYLWVLSQEAWTPNVRSRPLLAVYGARFDVTQAPFTDVRVRQAFNYAVDKSHTTKLLNRTTIPSHGMLAPGVLGRDDTLEPYPHDPAKARALLADAGFPHGLAIDYVTIADEEAEKIAASMQGDLAEVGVDMRISLVTGATYVSMIGTRRGPTFAFAGWTGDSPDPTNFLDAKFHSRSISDTASSNDSFYQRPELDALLDAAKSDADPHSRAERYRRAEKILLEDPPWLWNYHQTETEVSQPYVMGYQPHPVWVRDFTTVWLDLGPDGERVPR